VARVPLVALAVLMMVVGALAMAEDEPLIELDVWSLDIAQGGAIFIDCGEGACGNDQDR
jgi:hypothetical protein